MTVKRLAIALVLVGVGGGIAAWRVGGVSALINSLRPAAVEAQNLGDIMNALPDNFPEIDVDCAAFPVGPHGHDPDKQVFWGELHLHTQYSLDAYSFGTRTTPSEAYLFAKGAAPVVINEGTLDTPGPTIRQRRPLDFVAVTDHSEFLSVVQACTVSGSRLYNSPACQEVRSLDPATQDGIFPERMGALVKELCVTLTPNNNRDTLACVAQQRSAWVEMQRAARNAYRKCRFTSFVAYEWTDQDPQNLPVPGSLLTNHRNVIFASRHVPVLPFDSATAQDPPTLWTRLDDYCRGLCDAVTIPHNTNLSNGISLDVWNTSPKGRRLQRQYQVAAEIYQHKGASECYYHPINAPGETDCAFEQLNPLLEDTPIGPQSFLRAGLARGLAESLVPGQRNPLKLGFVGGTDGHNGAPGNVDEARWRGHDAREDSTPAKRLLPDPVTGKSPRTDWGPGGITAVWAEENSRESIFAAIKRRETYATSGPRMKVRVLQTSNASGCAAPGYPGSLLRPGRGHLPATPMGGTFVRANLEGAALPTFAIEVWRDQTPQALTRLAAGATAPAEIAKVQVIKIRALDNGVTVETFIDTPVDALADDDLHGDSFDTATGGCLVWTDNAFNPAEAALYYVRVLQEDTWRWSYHDCVALAGSPEGIAQGLTEAQCAAEAKNTVQERAWTSPIWYEPNPGLPGNAGAN